MFDRNLWNKRSFIHNKNVILLLLLKELSLVKNFFFAGLGIRFEWVVDTHVGADDLSNVPFCRFSGPSDWVTTPPWV
jgi:hypothetical protein